MCCVLGRLFLRVHASRDDNTSQALVHAQVWGVSSTSNLAGIFTSADGLSAANRRLVWISWGATFQSQYPTWTYYYITDSNVNNAVIDWIANPTTTASTTWGNIVSWDVSAVSNVNELFYATATGRSATFNGNLANWNVASVTDMMRVFKGVAAFNQPIGAWNVARVASFRSVFNGASVFNQDVSKWNVASATLMSDMFSDTAAFNQDISGWNVASVSNMVDLFNGAKKFNSNLARWNVRPGFCDVGRFSLQPVRFTRPLAGIVCSKRRQFRWSVREHGGAIRLLQALHL
jgi:surface protein